MGNPTDWDELLFEDRPMKIPKLAWCACNFTTIVCSRWNLITNKMRQPRTALDHDIKRALGVMPRQQNTAKFYCKRESEPERKLWYCRFNHTDCYWCKQASKFIAYGHWGGGQKKSIRIEFLAKHRFSQTISLCKWGDNWVDQSRVRFPRNVGK